MRPTTRSPSATSNTLRPCASSWLTRASSTAPPIFSSSMIDRRPTTTRSPVEAMAVTPMPGQTAAFRTGSARIPRVRAARRIAPAKGCVDPVSAPAARERTRAESSSMPASPSSPWSLLTCEESIASTTTSSGSPRSTVPRAFKTAVSAAPARSKARGSLYVIPLARASRWALPACHLDACAEPGNKERFSSGDGSIDAHDLLGLDDDLLARANFGRRKLHRMVAADGAYADVKSSLDVSPLGVHAKPPTGHESVDDEGGRACEAREDGDSDGMRITSRLRPTSCDDGTGRRQQGDERCGIRRIALAAQGARSDRGPRPEG